MDQAFSAAGLRYLAPEIALLLVAAFSMFVHLFFRKRGQRLAGYATLAGFALTAVILALTRSSRGEILSGSLTVDPFSLYFKWIFLVSGALAVFLSFRFFNVEKSEPGEIYYLLPLTLIGMMASASSVDLISSYVAFELFAIPSYVLAGIFKKERRSAEAGIKYFFLGTLSSGFMLRNGPRLRVVGRNPLCRHRPVPGRSQ